MANDQTSCEWWCEVSLRISHPQLDTERVSSILKETPCIAQLPGESRVPYGDIKSAGYWCFSHRLDAPSRPGEAIQWAEDFIHEHEMAIHELLKDECSINIYIGVFMNVLTLGFVIPATPTISALDISIGMEIFGR